MKKLLLYFFIICYPSFLVMAQMGKYYDDDNEPGGSIIDNWWILAIIIIVIFFIRGNREDKERQIYSDQIAKKSGTNNGKYYKFLILYNEVWYSLDAYGNSPQQAYNNKKIHRAEDVFKRGEIVMVKEFFDFKEKFNADVERLGTFKRNYGFLGDCFKNGWIPIVNSEQMYKEQPNLTLEHGIFLSK